MALAIELARAVATSLNDGVVPSTHQAVMRLKPRRDDDLIDTFIDVIPTPQTREIETRSAPDVLQSVLIAVATRAAWVEEDNDHSAEDVASVIGIAEDIATHFTGVDSFIQFGSYSAAAIKTRIGDEAGMMIDPDILDKHGIAITFLEIQFRVS